MELNLTQDLWHYLATADKPILLYGMGNGADKIIRVCEQKNIPIADCFASDGFVRGHSFHSKRVLSYSEAKERYGSFIVLLSFATCLPDVLENIKRVAAENELYAPDVPVFGDTLFDMEFYLAHKSEIEQTLALMADEESRSTMENVIRYKISGDITYLDACESKEAPLFEELLSASEIQSYVDLGAYNGDTIKKLLPYAPNLTEILALEPDERNFRKLWEYGDTLDESIYLTVLNYGAWSHEDELFFDASGNRNANLSATGGKKIKKVDVNSLDNILAGKSMDYIKYDVEGSEKEALEGSRKTIQAHAPKLLVSLYHRSEDIFSLPLMIHEMNPAYRLYVRKLRYIPAWDLNLYAIPTED